MSVQRVRLIHWHGAEAEERAGWLRSAGYEVDCTPLDPGGLHALREDPPSAVVIDLSRLPSQGRDVAVAFRSYKATRRVPLVFVGGDPEKVARIKELLPDATFTTWEGVGRSLEQAIAHPPAAPVVPGSTMAGYAGAPLPKKLGIKANMAVALIGAPTQFEATLGPLPEGVILRRQTGGRGDLTLWFVRSRQELEEGIEEMGACAEGGGLWILWPKKASTIATDLSQTVVRELGLASGLVDFKICAVDETWSGLRFTRRKAE